MSIRNTEKIVIAAAIALFLAVLTGCGSDDTESPAPTTAATGATRTVEPTASTGPTQAAEPTEPAANPNDPGDGDEEAARVGVAIGLKNGSFTKATARKVHVPSFIAIELDITVADNETYNLVIDGGDGRGRLVTYKKPGDHNVTLEGLPANKSATVVLGGEQQIKITADADPGP